MLNYIWAFMILLGVVYAAFTGNMSAVTNAALDSAGEAISLCITMAGVVALWTGLMEIAREGGIVLKLTKAINPFLKFMFPRIPEGHPAKEYIATNIIANVMGLGWACTPAGLRAMEELAKLEAQRGNPQYLSEGRNIKDGRAEYEVRQNRKRASDATAAIMQENGKKERVASNEMCTFLILNISSLQLIPVNMIAYRSQYGSTNPAIIIAPAILATLISTVTAVVYCKLSDHNSIGKKA